MIATDVKMSGKKLVEFLNTGEFKKVALVSIHGIGDQVMFQAPVRKLQKLYPNIEFKVALAKGLQEEFIFPEAIFVEGDWKTSFPDYDLVFACNFPTENLEDLTKTKAEICCEEELGIAPICGHLKINRKPLVGIHLSNTSVSWLANVPEDAAKKVWNEIIEANCVPVETLFQHAFYNDTGKRFDFVDNHVRNWPARLDTLISLLGSCDYFIGAVSGNFHLALSLLPYTNVALLEKDLKAEHFTKYPIQTFDIKNYKDGAVRNWLLNKQKI